jgi:hypothetical protein
MGIGKKKRPPAARATKYSVQEAMQRSPLPFAITRGAEHTLVYANSAFSRLAGIVNREAPGVAIATVFSGTEGEALSGLLDRASRDRVELLDAPSARTTGRQRLSASRFAT